MTLKADLPDHLYWLTEKVTHLVRPGAFLLPAKSGAAAPGATRHWGPPDLPADAAWAQGQPASRWCQAYDDGPTFAFQLDLGALPEPVREAAWPKEGVVWVFVDVSGENWRAWAEFDPRPAALIPWQPRSRADRPQPIAAPAWTLADTLTCATEATLPEIASDYHGGVGMGVDYDEWWQKHYGRDPSDFQLGGWMLPIQGDCDEARKTLVCALERQEFGDHGAIYLHYSAERGFFAEVWTH